MVVVNSGHTGHISNNAVPASAPKPQVTSDYNDTNHHFQIVLDSLSPKVRNDIVAHAKNAGFGFASVTDANKETLEGYIAPDKAASIMARLNSYISPTQLPGGNSTLSIA